MAFGEKIRKLDIFKKVPPALTQPTNMGGILSLITIISISYFLCCEIAIYVDPINITTLGIDSPITLNEVSINLDIIFPEFPCELISLDLQDIMMSHSPNIGSIDKYRLNAQGERMDDGSFQILREPNHNLQMDMARKAVREKYGCQVEGSFTVKEVPGNFHISSHAYQNIFVQLMLEGELKNIDMTHQIRHLSFGSNEKNRKLLLQIPEALTGALSGVKQIFEKSPQLSHTSHYHIDVVPTTFEGGVFGKTWTGYQYTYNHFAFPVLTMPSLYFNYHIGGMSVKVSKSHANFFHFLIRLCAVVGGIYAIANFLENALSHFFFDRSNRYKLVD